MKPSLLISLLLLLNSCGIYNTQFDCRPGQGIGCAPVGEVLDLILEKEEGEDIFVNDQGTALLLRREYDDKRVKTNPSGKKHYLIQDNRGHWRIVPLNHDQLKEKVNP